MKSGAVAYDKHLAESRAKWGRVTAYRIGLCVGYSGETLPPPSHYSPRSQRLYRDGVIAGMQQKRLNEAAQS